MPRYRIEEYVRWEDIDAAGIINYQAYLRFFGLAEAELFRSAGLSFGVMFDDVGIWLPRAHVECDFFIPVRLDELLTVDAWVGHIGRSSLHLEFEVRRKSEPESVVATGRYVLVCVKQGELIPAPLPDLVRERLGAFLEPSVRSLNASR